MWKVENEDIIDIVLCCNSLGTKDTEHDNVTETEHALSHRTTDLQVHSGLDCQRKNEEMKTWWRPMREAGMIAHRNEIKWNSIILVPGTMRIS